MKKLLLFITILLLSGCTVNYIHVVKKVYVFDGENMIEITGSELKDNTASQSANGELDLPLP